jgi:platelet-activating factor acetylhydrolase IB subunit alpha
VVSLRRHKSILDYLTTNGFSNTITAFKHEANQPDFQPDPKAKFSGLLEKKWTSVIRLQKKVSPSPIQPSSPRPE